MPASLSAPASTTRNYQIQRSCKWRLLEASSNVASTTVYASRRWHTLSSSSSFAVGTVSISASSMYGKHAAWQYRYSDDGGSSYGSWTTFSTSTSSRSRSLCRVLRQTLPVPADHAEWNSCSSVTSSAITVTVNSNYTGRLSPGTLIETMAALPQCLCQWLCSTITKWQTSPDNSTWTDGAGGSTYNYYGVNHANTLYRVVTANGACTATNSHPST